MEVPPGVDGSCPVIRGKIVKLRAINTPDSQLVAAALGPLIAARLKDEHEKNCRALSSLEQGSKGCLSRRSTPGAA
jgi:hypothetical protein